MLESGPGAANGRQNGAQAIVLDQPVRMAGFDKALLDERLIEFTTGNKLEEPEGDMIQFMVAVAGRRCRKVSDLALERDAAVCNPAGHWVVMISPRRAHARKLLLTASCAPASPANQAQWLASLQACAQQYGRPFG